MCALHTGTRTPRFSALYVGPGGRLMGLSLAFRVGRSGVWCVSQCTRPETDRQSEDVVAPRIDKAIATLAALSGGGTRRGGLIVKCTRGACDDEREHNNCSDDGSPADELLLTLLPPHRACCLSRCLVESPRLIREVCAPGFQVGAPLNVLHHDIHVFPHCVPHGIDLRLNGLHVGRLSAHRGRLRRAVRRRSVVAIKQPCPLVAPLRHGGSLRPTGDG